MHKYLLLIAFAIGIISCATVRVDYSDLPNLAKEFTYTTVYYNEKNEKRARLIGDVFDFGYTYLINNEFKEYPPERIKIYVYTTQRKMMGGLVLYAGLSEEAALFFRNGGAPTPINNIMHIGPSFSLSGVVHELVHAFNRERFDSAASFVNFNSNYEAMNEGLINSHLKWLDEGLADYFTHKIMLNHKYIGESQRKSQKEFYDHFQYLKEEIKIISVTELETLSQWINKIMEGDGIIIYPQCFILVTYLVSNYGIDKVFDIFKEVETGLNIKEAFIKIFNKTEEEIIQDIYNAEIGEVFGELYFKED